MKYRILYRGPLSSCNYGCDYCPFAKRDETYDQLEGDRQALNRFVAWTAAQSGQSFGIFFTPWGEALIRRWYQRALVTLSHLPHVERAAIQTNLSCGIDWVRECRLDRLALWTTFHPSEVERSAFVVKVRRLHEQGVRLSVGVVGLREHLDQIEKLRAEIPPGIYLWVNAYKRVASYYTDAEIRQLETIDPFFAINNQHHPSFSQPCDAGEKSFAVDGTGTMRRCHFVGEPIGTIYSDDWESALSPRPCPNRTCSCHIGYVNLHSLRQDLIYGDGILERIPLRITR
jgi:hypothetical protein